MTIQDAENKILALPPDGPYSHNIASLVLRQVASEHGYAAANALVVSLGLTTAYGIKPIGDRHPIGECHEQR